LAGRAPAAVSSVGPITARLGDRLIALILDTMFISAISWSLRRPFSRAGRHRGGPLGLDNRAASAGGVLLIAFIYYWLQEGAFGATMEKESSASTSRARTDPNRDSGRPRFAMRFACSMLFRST